MLSISERYNYIKEQLEKQGFVRVNDVAEQLGVTGATIRRDLRELEKQHVLLRNHGSASPLRTNVIDLPVQEKGSINADKKQRIAHAAASLIENNDSIIVTSGSTIEAFARAIQPQGTLNVATSSIRVGVILSEKEDVNILMLGGMLVKKSLSVRDAYTVQGLNNVVCSKCFFSCDGFDLVGGATTAFVEEVHLNKAMIERSEKAILLADSSKIGKLGFGQICPVEKIDVLITDDGIPASLHRHLEDLGLTVIIA